VSRRSRREERETSSTHSFSGLFVILNSDVPAIEEPRFSQIDPKRLVSKETDLYAEKAPGRTEMKPKMLSSGLSRMLDICDERQRKVVSERFRGEGRFGCKRTLYSKF